MHHKDASSNLPRFSFEFTGEIKLTTSTPPSPPHSEERELITDKIPYSHPSLNASAPVLNLALGNNAALTPRSATLAAKRISFAPNLSIYYTFSPTMYDRRSEPATCNMLTPALAQRIREELYLFKMEEMEVHVASRVQCVHDSSGTSGDVLTCVDSPQTARIGSLNNPGPLRRRV